MSISRTSLLRFVLLALLATAPAFAQSSPSPDTDQDIRQTIEQLKQLIQQQSLQIQQQQKEIEALQRAQQPATATVAPEPSPAPMPPKPAVSSVSAQSSVQESGNPYPLQGESPLFLKIGNAIFTPGGWVDFTSIYRTTDVGSGYTTALATIPFNNVVAGTLSENHLTAQNSRVSLRVDEAIGKVKVYGYAETDFNGYQPGNAYVSTNSDSLRLRVFYLNLSAGKWDVLGGQSWSLLTPNRSGLSPFLSEIYNTVHLDTAYNAGIIYARQAQLRVVYHFTPNIALGLSAENPDQFTGAAVTFPALFSNTEVDINSSTGSGGVTGTPNLHPDIIAKFAIDHKFAAHNWHVEVAGLLTPVAISTPASVTKTIAAEDIREGGGVAVNTNIEVVHGLHFIADSFWSDGGGRYIGGLGPSLVVAQRGSITAPFSAQLVHSGAGLAGFEYQATKKTLLSAIYGADYFDRVSSIDPSTNKLVGYGFAGSANTNNRTIQESTFSTVTNVFHKQSYGAVQIITQFSYIERTPWSVTTGQPKNAHLFENYFDIRYVLP